jgi:hypothetical protein
MESITYGCNIGSNGLSRRIERTGTIWENATETAELGVGAACVLTTRTSDTLGSLTFTATPPITSGTIDLVWVDADDMNQHRWQMTVTSYTPETKVMVVTGGTGTILPAQDYAVTIGGVRKAMTFEIVGNTMKMIFLQSDPPTGSTSSRAIVDCLNSGGASICVFELNDNEPATWANNGPFANPLAGLTVASLSVASLSAVSPVVTIRIVYKA